MTNKTKLHEAGLRNLMLALKRNGLDAQQMKVSHCKYDVLLGNGARIEFKRSQSRQRQNSSKMMVWNFNLHRHGKLERGTCDFYVFCIPPVVELGMKAETLLIVPASECETTKVVHISPRALMVRWGAFWNRFDLLAQFSNN